MNIYIYISLCVYIYILYGIYIYIPIIFSWYFHDISIYWTGRAPLIWSIPSTSSSTWIYMRCATRSMACGRSWSQARKASTGLPIEQPMEVDDDFMDLILFYHDDFNHFGYPLVLSKPFYHLWSIFTGHHCHGSWFLKCLEGTLGWFSRDSQIREDGFAQRTGWDAQTIAQLVNDWVNSIWVNYNDLTTTEPWKSWLVRGIIPKWP